MYSMSKTDYAASNLLSDQSDRCNAVVLSWILGSLSQDVYLGHVFSDNVAVVWKELQETYDRIDGSIVFNLLQKIDSFKQGGLPMFEYYHKLNSLWREFDILTKLPNCVCEARAELIDHSKLMKLMKFLMGLNDIYQPIRSSILTREILVEVSDAFMIVVREEFHRGIPPTSAKSDKPQASVFVSRTNDNSKNNVAMTKVIKGEFETLETLKINDVSLTRDTSLENFHNEFNRLSNMDDDLFTYKVKIARIANIPCDLNRDDDSEQQMSQEFDNDMEYDPYDVEFTA
nr:putative Gag-polypeptide of LTR copia-type [Tanacetum cinerariifolium]